ncbi:MAG: long-chain fatty acid--CoA ligase [Betaproteobacteria bacterium]|nr:long-chain fatty acid--CoA ligase [Betaproteobacteria bacterium]
MATIETIAWSNDLRTIAARFGDAPVVTDGQTSLSFTDLSRRAHALARKLMSMGIAAGESVAISVPNCNDAVWVSYGVTISGAAETPLNTVMTDTEIAWFASLAKFRYVVTHAARARSFCAMGYEPITIESIGDDDDGAPLRPVDANARGRILSSSGTTGRPKALLYSHGRRWLAHTMLKQALPYAPHPGSCVLLMTPFPHGAALMTYAWADFGGTAILLNGIDAARVGPILEGGAVDAVFAPPTVINKLSETFPGRRFDGVRCVFTGTQTLTPATYARAKAMFGPVVRVTYGKGECTNPITVLAPADTDRVYTEEADRSGACLGWPGFGVEIAVRNEAGVLLAIGEEGEIFLRARHMYIGHIDANGFQPIPPEGWHQTGDLGYFDERGRVWLTGRAADVIKSGGYKVNPEEIEIALGAVAECGQICITSIPSAYWGEVIVAAAEHVRGDWAATASERLASLSKYKHPRAFVALDALPRNPQGKVSRRAVRDKILERYTLEDGSRPVLVAKG